MGHYPALLLFGAVLSLSVAITRHGHATTTDPPFDKTLAPYFFVEDGDPGVDRLPLKSTRVKVAVSGVIADVSVKQIYENDGQRPIHATYVFPASTRAAVHGMRMKVADQDVEARVRERKLAQQEFETAKREGKTASLLEQQRPNVFSMRIGNVMPGDTLEVELSYTEMLIPAEGVYEFVFPTVVGPRYSSETERAADESKAWVKTPYLPEGHAAPSSFHLEATLSAPVPIASLAVPTHKVTEVWQDPTTVGLALAPSEAKGKSRDFVARYRLTDAAVASGISLYDGKAKKFFLAAVQPPERVAVEQMPPREFVFVVDVSGSMHGFPLDTAKTLLRSLVGGLRSIDRFNVVLFSGGSSILAPESLPASRAHVAAALRAIDGVDAGGGTELGAALLRAAALSRQSGLSRSFVVVTDGYIAAEREVFRQIRANLGNANVFCFGIGSSVNRYLVEGMARAGLGEPFVVTEPKHARAVAERFREYVSSPALTDVRVTFEGFDAYDVQPTTLPDVLAHRPVVLFGKWRGKPQGKIVVSGVHGRGRYRQTLDIAKVEPKKENRALPYLWARARLTDLSDFSGAEPSAAERQQIVQLGLTYNLLTRYTSFIAVAHAARNRGGVAERVEVPLALPAGVSNHAVGSPLVGADEPELVTIAIIAFLLGLVALARRHLGHGLVAR